jgi:hypothetical protein
LAFALPGVSRVLLPELLTFLAERAIHCRSNGTVRTRVDYRLRWEAKRVASPHNLADVKTGLGRIAHPLVLGR